MLLSRVRTAISFRIPTSVKVSRRLSSSEEAPSELKRTALYDLHLELGARMMDYGGYAMPLSYKAGILASHLHTRKKSSLFDVSHMSQYRIFGADRHAFVEYVTTADLKSVPEFGAVYTLVPTFEGGIIEDTIVTNGKDFISMEIDPTTYEGHLVPIEAEWRANGRDVVVDFLKEYSFIALQGPLSEGALQRHTKTDLSLFKFLSGNFVFLDGVQCYVQRSGYTGEDGFEISVPTRSVEKIFRALLNEPEVLPAGLGARDSLRLSAGLCLSGTDIHEQTTPRQAKLTWTIDDRRKAEANFVGAKSILEEMKLKVSDLPTHRVGLLGESAMMRGKDTIHDPETGAEIGEITSGVFSPVLRRPIAMGYVASPHYKTGSKVFVNSRGKMRPAVVTTMPFETTNYKK